MLAMGEVVTGLLQHSVSVSPAEAARILTLRIGDNVRSFARPISYVVSPDLYTGLDCAVGGGSGPRVRGVGTARSQASITGGQIVQAGTTVVLRRGDSGRRMPWSHYLSRPGEVEALGKLRGSAVAQAWLGDEAGAPALGAISARLLDDVQSSPLLQRPSRLRAARTRLRWVAELSSDGRERIDFSLETSDLRLVRIAGSLDDVPAIAEFCADLALHDWLLTTLQQQVQRSGLDTGAGAAAVLTLRPVVEHLLHLWMPAARSHPSVLPYWTALERAPGLDRQWAAGVARIRDHIAIDALAAAKLERSDVG